MARPPGESTLMMTALKRRLFFKPSIVLVYSLSLRVPVMGPNNSMTPIPVPTGGHNRIASPRSLRPL